jgi:hypothetical protein
MNLLEPSQLLLSGQQSHRYLQQLTLDLSVVEMTIVPQMMNTQMVQAQRQHP